MPAYAQQMLDLLSPATRARVEQRIAAVDRQDYGDRSKPKEMTMTTPNTISTSDLHHGMQVIISGRRTFDARKRLSAMGLKWDKRQNAWVGVIDDPTGNHVFGLGKFAGGLTIEVQS